MSVFRKISAWFGQTTPVADSTDHTKAVLEPLEYSRNAAGRVPVALLEKAAFQLSCQEFCNYVRVPSLIGSAVHRGHVTSRAMEPGNRKKTFVFIPSDILEQEEKASSSDTLQRAVYPLIRDQKKLKSDTPNSLSIGRDTDCDIVMPDTPISERQARIYVVDNQYSLHDTSSTNGTWLNGARLQSDPVPLSDGARIRFARYEFTFLFPETVYAILQRNEKA